MCIRDRLYLALADRPAGIPRVIAGPVSYTHLPTPVGGGLVIVVVCLVGVTVAWFFYPTWTAAALLAYLSGAALIAFISWQDDLHAVPIRVRLTIHSLGAVLAILGFGYWSVMTLPLVGPLALGWLGLIMTFVWIVGLTNAYNFMDGIDGIAGGQAVVAGLGWTCLLYTSRCV